MELLRANDVVIATEQPYIDIVCSSRLFVNAAHHAIQTPAVQHPPETPNCNNPPRVYNMFICIPLPVNHQAA